MTTETTKTVTVKLNHNSSIPQARWEPTNEVEGAEFLDGSWWGVSNEEAGLVCFVRGDEGDEIEVSLDDLRVVSTGNCRVISKVEI
jgi:hypothetical protein